VSISLSLILPRILGFICIKFIFFSIPRISSNLENPEDVDENMQKPIYTFLASEKHQIYSLAFHKDFLIVGTIDLITGYLWNGKTHKITKMAWEVKLPVNSDMLDKAEVNYLWLDVENEHLYAGCGDNNIYCINLEDGKVLKTLEGHKDFIHCVDGRSVGVLNCDV
jgi:THO complex subunit 6